MAKDQDAAAAGDKDGKKGGKLKLIAIILPVVLLLTGAGVYLFVLSPGSKASTSASATEDGASAACEDAEECETSAAPTPSTTYEPGAVVAVEPVTINLAGGHFLQVGLSMQATKDAGEEVDPGKAADALITEFSGKTVAELSAKDGRESSKKALLKTIKKAYEKKVYEIYYTSFVLQ